MRLSPKLLLRAAAGRAARSGRRLAGLLADVLALVADARALIGLGLAQLADVRRGRAHELLAGPAHGDHRLLGIEGQGDALGRLEGHRMGLAERERQLLAGDLAAEAEP